MKYLFRLVRDFFRGLRHKSVLGFTILILIFGVAFGFSLERGIYWAGEQIAQAYTGESFE
jgi:hypothetical protein